jgi:hypothetical protein
MQNIFNDFDLKYNCYCTKSKIFIKRYESKITYVGTAMESYETSAYGGPFFQHLNDLFTQVSKGRLMKVKK